jgi:hypothetical protein
LFSFWIFGKNHGQAGVAHVIDDDRTDKTNRPDHKFGRRAMPAKRGTGKAKPPAGADPAVDAPASAAPAVTLAPAEDEPAVKAAPESASVDEPAAANEDQGEQPLPEPANRAERRALAQGKVPQQATGKVKQYGRGPVAGPTHRRWQGRRGG